MAKKSIEDILSQHFGVNNDYDPQRVEVETEFGEIIPAYNNHRKNNTKKTPIETIEQAIDQIINSAGGNGPMQREIARLRYQVKQDEQRKREDFIAARGNGYDGTVQGAYGSKPFGDPRQRQADGSKYMDLKADQQTVDVILGRAQKALDTYSEADQKADIAKGKEKSWLGELFYGVKNTNTEDLGNIAFMNFPTASHTSKVNEILEKSSKGNKLTDSEQFILQAQKLSQDAEQSLANEGGATAWASIGESLPASAGFMVETFLTGNMLGVARTAATKGIKALGNLILDAGVMEAARTPLRGSMYSNIADRTTDQYTVQDDGSVVKDNPTSFAERLWKGYASTYSEALSEQMGNVMGSGWIGRGFNKAIPKLIGAKAGVAVTGTIDALATNTKQFRDFMRKATGYNGTVDEFLEEEFNNIVEPLLTGEPERIKDNFTLKNQAITLGSVAVMGATMHTMSLPSTIAVASDKSKMRRGINASINSIEIPTLRQEVYNTIKKGATIEDRAEDFAKFDWQDMSVKDRANAIDAFNKSIILDIYNGFELSRKTDEVTAQKIQTWNAIYQQSANTDTGAIEELADEQDNRYLLLAGSLEDMSTDETLFVRNAQTGRTEQISKSTVRRVGEAETYESGLRKIVEQSATQASEQILDEQSAEEDQDAQEIGVQPVTYGMGENVTLADGRQGQFLGYHNDGSNIAQVAFIDQQTGEQESVEVPKSQIVGLTYQSNESTETIQEPLSVEQSKQGEDAQQAIPMTKDGSPDYDAMPADMYLEEYSKIASRDEALEDLRSEKIAIEKQIKRLQSSNNATSRNTKIANRAKVATLQAKVDDIGRVLQENTQEQSAESQSEQISLQPTAQPSSKSTTLKEAMLDLGDYISIEDYILRDIATGLKFRWSDDGASRGLATELGFNGREQERKSRIGILKNDGTTIDRYAESLSGLLGNSIPAFNVDEQDIRNIAIDVLGSVSSPAQAAAKVKAFHSNNFDEQANDYYLGELEKYKLDVAEYDAALELWVNELSDEYFAEINALFEPELLTLRDQNTNNDGYNQTDPRGAYVTQNATTETSQDESRGRGDNDRRSDQNIDFRGETEGSDAGQDDQRVDDPIFSAQTQEQKYRAVKDYVDQLNQLSGADAVVFSELNQISVQVAASFEAQWQANPDQETPGVTLGTKAYIYAPHIKDIADLETVFNHEIAAHRNILLALGQDRRAEAVLYSAVVDDIGVPKMLQFIEDPVFLELADLYFETPTQSRKIELGKEFVGYFTENHFDKKEYSKVGAGKLSLNLSEKITVEDVINILNAVNSKGNEQRIIIEDSTDWYGQMARKTGDTRNMGQIGAGRGTDLSGGGSDTVLAPENTASGLSGTQRNTIHVENRGGSSAEGKSDSEAEIRRKDIRGASGAEQTGGARDARPNSRDKTKELKSKNNVWNRTTDIQSNGEAVPSEQFLGAETNDSPSTDGGQDDRSSLEAARQTIQQQPTSAIIGSVDSIGRDNLTTSQSLDSSVSSEQSISEGRIADSGDDAGRNLFDGLRAQVERGADDSSHADSRADAQVIRRQGGFLVSDELSIAETLPQLLPDQQKDVLKAERRFFTGAGVQAETGSGILFTNGTGTGKTYTGLGIVKRFILMGKPNILIVAPTDKVVKDWVSTARNAFAVELSQLDGVLDQGESQCVTTYANFRQNSAIVNRKFDLVIYDESHYLNQNAAGTRTSVQDKSDQIVLSVSQAMSRAQIELASTMPTGTEVQQYSKELEQWNGEVLARAKEIYASRAKVVMLSATPFAYHKSLAYADGLLFTINETFDKDDDSSGYNEPNRWERFMVSNFGYRMRYNKLTQPENKHSASMLERLFYDKLVKQGVASGRSIDVPFDYSRDFAVVTSGIGEQIDKGMQAVSADARLFLLAKTVSAKWSFVKRSQFLEAVKSEGIMPYIDQLLAKKRKVVVFHNFMKENTENPLHFTKLDNKPVEALSERQMSQYKELLKRFSSEASQMSEQDLSDFERLDAQITARQIYETVGRYDVVKYNEQVDIWNEHYSEFANLDFSGIKSPINAFVQHYGGRVVLFNGQVSKKTRSDNTVKFNTDNSNVDVILVQRQAGKEGISFHDRSGAHQRVLINLGLPTAPTDAIQIEGRIYRIGLKSNAAFIYPIINTSFERFAFAQTIASRSKTAENLALGSNARRLESAFKDGYQNAVDVSDLDIDQLGVGTKVTEAESGEQITPYQEAVALYATNAKNSNSRSQREGVDYFATPEPIGFKMVEWLGLQDNDRVLEPSAGHGAIARFFPDNVRAVAIEPSNALSSKLSINTNATLIQSTFEDYYIGNKFDGIVMNPPFGVGGETAIEHLEKAYNHLSFDGGRVIAIIPSGVSAEKRFDNFMYGVGANGKLIHPEAHFVAEILLPSSTFKNAGTNVSTRIVVVDKIVSQSPALFTSIDLTSAETTEELFDKLEEVQVPPLSANDIRYRQIEPDNTVETDMIRQQAVDRGDFLKAPNGEPTNLTEHQWLQVRTAAFKEWFGDWEKAARIEKLHNSTPVEITGEEIAPSEDLKQYKRNALEYGKSLRGEYVNKDTGETIVLGGGSKSGGLREILHHDYKDIEHLQSIAAIPQIIEKSIFIIEEPNDNIARHPKISKYRYYVCGLTISGIDYTVKAVVSVDTVGKSYYDHKLTQIEKGVLISGLPVIQKTGADNNTPNLGLTSKTDLKESYLFDTRYKDIRLLSILQTNSSKVVDANGEPMVVYHGTDSDFYEFSHDKISNQEGSFFFAQNIEDAEGYSSGALIEAFVNLRNPANFEDLPLEVLRLNDKKAIVERLKSEGYDGWVEGLKDGWGEISAFNPNQIKSATENTGNFSSQNNDIRYSDQSLLAETQSQHEYEQDKANTYVNVDKRKAQVVEQLQKLTAKFGVEAVIVDSAHELPQSVRYRTRNARFGGLYDKQDGKVYFVANEIKDADEATATFLHEVVSHKGIDALMGREGANQFYVSVFDSLPRKEQTRLLAKYGNKVVAGDELVARMAEGDVTPSVMQRVIAAVRKFFREVLGFPLTISDSDIRYILWKSKNNLERASTLSEVFSVIERDNALRTELYPTEKPLIDQIQTISLRYRDVKPASATDKTGNEYLRVSGKKNSLLSNAIQIQEAIQDETIKVHLLQKEIKRRGGQITALTNLYEAINHRDSIADAQMAKYGRRYIKPFINLITQLKKKDVEYGDVSTYLLAKHSIERHLSGTNALSDDDQRDWTMESTSQIVKNFESKLTVDELANLWQIWHRATERIIDIAVQSGRMSLESKEAILARWKYYVPLRGKDWEFEGEENLADIFYADRSVGRGKSPSKKVANIKALGRISKAADPISTLQNMANAEIYLSAINNVNRSLLRLVNEHHAMTDLFKLKERWYVKKGESWYASDDKPSIEQIKTSSTARITKKKLERELVNVVDFDKRAELEQQIEDANSQITVSRHERDARGYNGLDPKAAEVVVMKDGVKYVIEMGDVEVAKAINGNSGSVQRWLSQYPGRVTRVMAQLSTSKNPAFILPNLVRDFQHAALYNFVDQDGYTLGYMRNLTTSWAVLHRNITDKANPLTVAEIGNYNLYDADHRKQLAQRYGRARIKDTMYDLFVMNGGETGYVHILEPAEYQRKVEKEIRTAAKGNVAGKGWKALNNGVDYLASISENAVRFATFMSQIEKGSNVFDSVSYAKNITVNFNRKGKYSKGIGALFMFFNAGVQGAVNTYSLWGNKNDRSKSQIAAQRARFIIANSTLAAIGYISAALIYEMLSSMAGDDGEEFQISDYERRTNLIIPAGNENGYIKIPIPISFRPFYSLGVMTNDWVNGKIEASDVMGVFSQSIVDAVSPLQVGYSLQTDNAWALAKPFIPSSVKPLAEIGYNQNFLGRPINREATYSPNTPDSELGQKNVNKIALTVSRWLNKLGGGNEITAAGVDEQGQKDLRNWLDISPSTLEHIVTSYTGGVGKMINETRITITGDQREARKIPIANRFYGEAYEKDPSREYYDIKKNIERVNRNNKKVEELGIASTLFSSEEFPTKKAEYAKYEDRIKQVERKTRLIKEKLGQIQFGSQEYDLLESQIDKLQRQFIKQYNDQRN